MPLRVGGFVLLARKYSFLMQKYMKDSTLTSATVAIISAVESKKMEVLLGSGTL